MDQSAPFAAPDSARRFIPQPQTVRRSGGTSGHYSRFVSLMKILLPILALTLIVAILAWPGAIDRGSRFQLSFADYSANDVALEMTNPRYLAIDRRNRPVTVVADAAYQAKDDASRVHLSRLEADFTLENETWISFAAGEGIYHPEKKHVALAGPINVFSDAGYEFHAEEAEIFLEDGIAISHTPVTGQGPLGRLRADQMRVEAGGKHIILDGNVRVVLHTSGAGSTP